MKNGYVIKWKSKVNGRAGRGTKIFSHEEAERLVGELNHEYPEIVHEAVPFRDLPSAPDPHTEPATEDASGRGTEAGDIPVLLPKSTRQIRHAFSGNN